jgi:hypothetical protein
MPAVGAPTWMLQEIQQIESLDGPCDIARPSSGASDPTDMGEIVSPGAILLVAGQEP